MQLCNMDQIQSWKYLRHVGVHFNISDFIGKTEHSVRRYDI